MGIDEHSSDSDADFFMHGWCHVLAVALCDRLTELGASVAIYEVQLQRSVVHFVVGRWDLGFLDARLKWERWEGFTYQRFPEPAAVQDLAQKLHQRVDERKVEHAQDRARVFLYKNDAAVRRLAQELATKRPENLES